MAAWTGSQSLDYQLRMESSVLESKRQSHARRVLRISMIYLVRVLDGRSALNGIDQACRPCRRWCFRLIRFELVAPEIGARRAALSPVCSIRESVWSPVGQTAPILVSEGDR